MSAYLVVVKGPMEGQRFPLTRPNTVLGRNPECTITIPDGAVSRSHASIQRENGRFYLQDLDSRNKTYLNEMLMAPLQPRELKDADVIRICNTVAEFRVEPEPKGTIDFAPGEAEDEGAEEGSATVEATLQHSSSVLFETHPADKLHSLLEISAALGRTLELEGLLPKIVDCLFKMFKQADRCFVIQHDQVNDRLLPKLVKTRRPQDEENARFSRTIVRQCLESKQLFLSNDAGNHPGLESHSVVEFRIRSVMCAPLIAADGRAFGVIQLDTQNPSRKFTKEDMQLLMGVANQAAIALENARLYKEGQERARLDEATRTAREVQLSFLPKRMPEVPGYEFFAHYEAAENVGGDYYGFEPLGGTRLAVCLGDVAGKGIPAALLMAKLSSDLRYCLSRDADVAGAVAGLNEMVYENAGQMERFVTLAVLVLDTADHSVTIVNAGHLTPQLYRAAAGQVADATPREVAGLPLGVIDGQTYDVWRIALEPGDVLVVYSDGVTDAANVQNKQFGAKAVLATLQAAQPRTAEGFGKRLVGALKEHTQGREQRADDVTLVCFGRSAG